MEVKIFMSKDARKIINLLDTIGIKLELGENGIFDVEVACSQFYPNHIAQVIQTCLKGKNAIQRLENAYERGWEYFNKPTFSMLSGRNAAWQEDAPIIDEAWNKTWARRVYGIVMTAFMPHDINRAEANSLLFDVPNLSSDRDALLAAIRSAKDRRVRSIPYLHAILERNHAKRQAEKAERDEKFPLWEPGVVNVADSEEARKGWERAQRRIDIIQGFKNG